MTPHQHTRRPDVTSVDIVGGAEAIEVAAAILQQKDVKKEIVFASPMVTKENLSQFFDADRKERIVPPVDMAALGL